MKQNSQGPIQFIISSYPGNSVPAEVQRRAHSHAARATHAKTRHLRVREYQASKTSQASKGSERSAQGNEEQGFTSRGCGLPTLDAFITGKLALPSPVSLLGADRTDPFDSFARPLKPYEHFLLDHYVNVVIPYMNTNCNRNRDPERYIDLMTRDWVRLTVTDIGSLSGVFLAACRHLLANHEQQQQYYKQLAIHYKVLCVRTLREAISLETSSLISDSTVAINILLAYDEVQVGDLSMLRRHLQGLVQMVEHNGGPQTLGANGLLERLVYKFVGDVNPLAHA